jgi:large subunit ribosomal protein L11
MIIKLLVEGGGMKPGPALSQKLGPLGINLGKVLAEVNKATADFVGMKVPATLDINTKTKEFTVKISTPPTAELLKKELGFEKGSGQPNKLKIANIALEQIINVAKTKQNDMIVNSLKEAVKSVIGTCVSLGILVESKDPKAVLEEIDKGEYDPLIKKGVDVAPQEKLAKLAADFEQVRKVQEALIKEMEKKAEEEAAAPAATAAPTEEEAAKPSAEKKPAEEKKKK